MILARIPPSPRLLSRRVVSALLVLALSVSTLGGCVAGGPRSTEQQDPGEDFAVLGKLAVRGPAGSFSARFSWQQTGELFALELWGPFGQGRRRLRGSFDELVVLNGAGQVLVEGPSREVLERSVGIALPLQSLRFWIQGLPDPSLPVQAVGRDPAMRALSSFEQAGWAVRITERFDGLEPSLMSSKRPKRISAIGEGYEIRLVLNRWGVPDSAY